MPFDVEPTIKAVPKNGFTPKHRRAIMSANLMSYLLEDVTFGELYGGHFGLVLPKIRKQASLLEQPSKEFLNRGAYHRNFRIKSPLYKAIRKIESLFGIEQVILGRLFTCKFEEHTTEGKMVKILKKIYSEHKNEKQESQFEHLCLPFLYFQEEGVRTLEHSDITEFLAAVGHKRLIDLYKEGQDQYTEIQLEQLKKARCLKILVDHSTRGDGKIGINTFPPSNGLRCGGNGECVESDNDEDWCNTAGTSCSAAST